MCISRSATRPTTSTQSSTSPRSSTHRPTTPRSTSATTSTCSARDAWSLPRRRDIVVGYAAVDRGRRVPAPQRPLPASGRARPGHRSPTARRGLGVRRRHRRPGRPSRRCTRPRFRSTFAPGMAPMWPLLYLQWCVGRSLPLTQLEVRAVTRRQPPPHGRRSGLAGIGLPSTGTGPHAMVPGSSPSLMVSEPVAVGVHGAEPVDAHAEPSRVLSTRSVHAGGAGGCGALVR